MDNNDLYFAALTKKHISKKIGAAAISAISEQIDMPNKQHEKPKKIYRRYYNRRAYYSRGEIRK